MVGHVPKLCGLKKQFWTNNLYLQYALSDRSRRRSLLYEQVLKGRFCSAVPSMLTQLYVHLHLYLWHLADAIIERNSQYDFVNKKKLL